jgi:hypothetical protein
MLPRVSGAGAAGKFRNEPASCTTLFTRWNAGYLRLGGRQLQRLTLRGEPSAALAKLAFDRSPRAWASPMAGVRPLLPMTDTDTTRYSTSACLRFFSAATKPKSAIP